MLKIVPDPPTVLEDTLVQTSEHVRCALAVAQQSIPLISRSPGSMLVLAALHEMETVKALLDSALAQVQATLH
ncbi:hypothetical protein [Pseudomonas entomophila]|uniref:DUF3077 domain-containing protein n=2 Tax=Pseudomonas entomophila TaxID=312306 RepID=Q1I9P0_PSEE4|nr:hypothetical protein [Pseudomonas entomophila]WMW03622.1 hypothetical protein RAH46_14845 [Pseudomonas entomophila]CAK15634.1 conserved hypothetical protein [Pseudomonas entomophila L48]